MNKEQILKLIKEKARRDARNRKDRRFLTAMGFLVAKGFLKTNLQIPLTPNKKLKLQDVIWAGLNVEPRILEVLPAAVLRLDKHFDLDKKKHENLAKIIGQLKKEKEQGDDFFGVPFAKLKVWVDLPLKDGRMISFNERKITKTYRLNLESIRKLKELSQEWHCSETEALQRTIVQART